MTPDGKKEEIRKRVVVFLVYSQEGGSVLSKGV